MHQTLLCNSYIASTIWMGLHFQNQSWSQCPKPGFRKFLSLKLRKKIVSQHRMQMAISRF